MSKQAIDITGVNLAFRGRTILEDVNLSLPEGAFLGLIGPNGAGKTVLLKVLLGLIAPDSGTVRVLGKPPFEARGCIGYVPQYAHFDADFPISVVDAVLTGRLAQKKLFSRYSKSDVEIAEDALAKVEMSESREVQVGKLSGGQLQRVLIARALAVQPKILFLDEPTASIDTRIGQSVYQLLDSLADEMTIVLVSHDIGVISQHVKTVACLNRKLHYHDSKKLEAGVIEEVYGCPVELVAHGHAHRVFPEHGEEEE